jgi:hypothetical protein
MLRPGLLSLLSLVTLHSILVPVIVATEDGNRAIVEFQDLPEDINSPQAVLQSHPLPKSECKGTIYTTVEGDTCNSIAIAHHVSSMDVYMHNQFSVVMEQGKSINCSSIDSGMDFCLPAPCKTYAVQSNDTCRTIEASESLGYGTFRAYNPMINVGCPNLRQLVAIFGNTMCISPHHGAAMVQFIVHPVQQAGYMLEVGLRPYGIPVAHQTTLGCGKYYNHDASKSCANICFEQGILLDLFLLVNPSLSASDCDASLIEGKSYCVGPIFNWEEFPVWDDKKVISTDGSCNSHTTCLLSTFGPCCGASGKCGYGENCAWQTCNLEAGECHNQPGNKNLTTDGSCGPSSVGQMTCEYGGFKSCCGTNGRCGNKDINCASEHCQKDYGVCWPPAQDWLKASNPVSHDGLCASNSVYNSTCARSVFGQCCSRSGNCGDSLSDCSSLAGCQAGFGKCEV